MKKVRSKLYPTKIGVIKTFSLSPDDEIGEIAVECTGCTYYYNNLAELCEKWKDYEEPKGFWMINILGIVEYTHGLPENEVEMMKAIGNYFETREEAELAVRKLKAWERLKEKGLKITEWSHGLYLDTVVAGRFRYEFPVGNKSDIEKDLDLLFGGEE